MNAKPSRRSVLKLMGGAGLAAAAYPALMPIQSKGGSKPRNIIIFLTDQDRALRWFPEGWAEDNLPCLTALRQHGMEFRNAFTNTCMCTPSRTSIFTGLYPAQHLNTDTLTDGFTQSFGEHQLDANLPNLATVLKSGGYDVIYKGKWHLSKPVHRADGTKVHDDISRYGFDGWNPPDAGEDTKVENYGGGDANNDGRFVRDALEFLQARIDKGSTRPFCLVVSLVNPHDVLGYPGNSPNGGYSPAMLQGPIQLPPTVDENLFTNRKPTVHGQLLIRLAGLGVLGTTERMLNYINFYGNLIKLVDTEMYKIIQLLEASEAGRALHRDTMIIRIADHGEMGLTHGGLRQKAFMAYEEAINIPCIWSNPVMFPKGQTSDALVSHVDFLPTLASFCNVPNWNKFGFAGFDYSSIFSNPNLSVQDEVIFTYDDICAGQQTAGHNGVIDGSNRLQMIRTKDYKFVRYWDAFYDHKEEEEFYNLVTDVDAATGLPVELHNVSAWADRKGLVPRSTPQERVARAELKQRLEQLIPTRLAPRAPSSNLLPMNEVVEPYHWTDDEGSHSTLDVRFVSQSICKYQVQKMVGAEWTNVGDELQGHNGQILVSLPFEDPTPDFRVVRTLLPA